MTGELDALLSEADQRLLKRCLEQVMGHRFGVVHLVIEKGRVRFIRPEVSYETKGDEADAPATPPETARLAAPFPVGRRTKGGG